MVQHNFNGFVGLVVILNLVFAVTACTDNPSVSNGGFMEEVGLDTPDKPSELGEPTSMHAESFNVLSDFSGENLAQVDDEDVKSAVLDKMLTEKATQLLYAHLWQEGCTLLDEGITVVEMRDEDDEGFRLGVIPANCTASDDAFVAGMFDLNSGEFVAAHAEVINPFVGAMGSVTTLDIVDGRVVQAEYDIAEAAKSLDGGAGSCDQSVPWQGSSEFETACMPLSADTECWICKKVAGYIIGKAGKACGWAGVTVCGALGLAGGIPGVVCAGSLWALCKYGIYKLKSWGSYKACKYAGYCA
jgi:hypothetical protein